MKTFLIVALTADGVIGKDSGHRSLNWRSDADSKFFIQKTKEAGVVVMGKNTFETMKRPMPNRLHYVYSNEKMEGEGVETTTKNPAELLQDIEKLGYREGAICGGATICTMFMKAGLIATLYLTIEPRLFGEGVRLLTEDLDVELKLEAIEQVEDTVILEYKVKK